MYNLIFANLLHCCMQTSYVMSTKLSFQKRYVYMTFGKRKSKIRCDFFQRKAWNKILRKKVFVFLLSVNLRVV